MSAETLLNNLYKVKKVGRGKWMACCPHHEDKNPSLSITECENDHILIKCHAGCSAEEVMFSAGLEMKDLFPEIDQHSFTSSQYNNYKRETKRVEHTNEELSLLEAKIDFYQRAMKTGWKFSPEEHEKYKQLFITLRSTKGAKK